MVQTEENNKSSDIYEMEERKKELYHQMFYELDDMLWRNELVEYDLLSEKIKLERYKRKNNDRI